MTESTLWVPKTEEEKDQVRQQMNRLLETSHFNNSRRYPALFRFIVEETLEGRGEFLKERLLGVRVFSRPTDYDTANDPIVRVTIAEIRKRIAQYYHEEAHESEMRIELLPGHYEPEFHPHRPRGTDQHQSSSQGVAVHQPRAAGKDGQIASPPAVYASDSQSPQQPRRKHLSLLVRCGIWAAGTAVLVLCATILWRWAHPSADEEFWRPVLAAHRTIMFCLPAGAAGSNNVAVAAGIVASDSPEPHQRPAAADIPAQTAVPTFLDHEKEGENVTFSDVLAMQRISTWLASRAGQSMLRLNVDTTLDDLQQRPAILVGGLDNNWTLREVAHLRYRFSGNDQEQYWIVDSKNPGNRDWELDLNSRYPAVQRDYALIARFHDESTRQVEVIVAGIGMSGTAAAGKFLIDPDALKELRRRVGAGFRDRDFEAVLSMDVVNGMAGSPRILAVAVW